jgi:hypothetical protein
VSRHPPRMRRSSVFASFPSVPDAPPQEGRPQGEAGDTSRREGGEPTLSATGGTTRCEEADGGDGGDELDESELPAEFGIGVGGSGARPPSPAPSGKLAGFPAPPPFAGRGRADNEACDEGDDLSELPVEFFACAPSSAAPPTPPTEMPMEFFACAVAAGAGAGRLGTSSSAAPPTSRATRALQALPMNQVQASGAVKRGAPTKGNLSEPLSTPFQDAFQELSDAFHRAIDSDSARPVKLAETPDTFPESVCGIIDL